MKKLLCFILSLTMLATVAFGFGTNAYAASWEDYIGYVDGADLLSPGYFYGEIDRSDYRYNYRYHDIYQFKIPVSATVTVKFASDCSYLGMDNTIFKVPDNKLSYIYTKASGYDIGSYTVKGIYLVAPKNYRRNVVSTNKVDLPAGTYCLAIAHYDDFDHCDCGANNEYKLEITYKPKFKNPTLSKVYARDNGFKATWYKRSGVTGYQIQYSTRSDMSGAKYVRIKGQDYSAKTIRNLKNKKKYYVRVRTYKTIKAGSTSKNFYSKWSSKKSVITK